MVVLDGEPIAKQRPRFNVHSKAVYNPQRLHESIIKRDIANRLPDGFSPIAKDTPIVCDVYLYFPIPKSKVKKIKDGAPHIIKPDRDNSDKWVLDCCNGIVWHDDCQIYDGRIRKLYSNDPRTEIIVKW